VLDALEIVQPVVCIGTSWGSLVAGEFALHYPQRTRAVVMLNAPVFPSRARLRDGFVAWGARWLSGTSVYVKGVAEGYFMPATREREADFMARFRQHIHDIGGKALAQVVRSVLLDRETSPRPRCLSLARTISCALSMTSATSPPSCRVAVSSSCRRLISRSLTRQ
jgi:pimeloyl-ACP methyl ester carboxylesterase